MEILIITSRFYIPYMEALFHMAKIIRSSRKNDGLLFIQNWFAYDYDHYSTRVFKSVL